MRRDTSRDSHPRYAARHRTLSQELRDVAFGTAGGRQPPLDLAILEFFNAFNADVVAVDSLLLELGETGVGGKVDGDRDDDAARSRAISEIRHGRAVARTLYVASPL